MRAQITDGIHTAMNENSFDLSDGEVEALTESILDALSQSPGAVPTLVTAPAGPALSVSAADVVAMVATAALAHDSITTNPTDDNHLHCDYWIAGEDRRAYRQFLFAVQPMFGIRVRTATEGDDRLFLVVGTRPQIDAMNRVCTTLRGAASAQTDGLSADELLEFWATLGHLVSSTVAARDLIARNTGNYAEATAHLNAEFGPARNLARTDPAESGPIRARAEALVPTEPTPNL